MARVKFTVGEISDHTCEAGKSQSFIWDTEAPGLGLRVTANGAKSFMFQAKLNGAAIRVTIGDPKTWDLAAARREARHLKGLVDKGEDPRKIKADKLAAEQAEREARAAAEAV